LTSFASFFAAGVVASLLSSGASAAQTPPNVVLIIADDLGYGDIGCFGAQLIETPALDRIASEGAKLTSFYVHASCSPTRAALLTGRYAQRVGIDAPFGTWSPRGLPSTEVTLAEALQARGYRTGWFGKWHLGDSPDQLPDAQGFEDWFGTPWGLLGRPDILLDTQGPEVLSTDPPSWTRQFTDRTLAFIADSVALQRPFFAVLAHHLPHSPATPGPSFIGQSADGREYGDGVEEIDAGVAEILAHLEALDIERETIVMFFSDNGPANAYGAYQQGSPGPLSGWKGTTLEGGMRVPCVVRWPDNINPGLVTDEPLFVADLFPTLLALIDGAAPAPGLYDGRDVRNVLLHGQAMPPGEDAIYYVAPGGLVDGVRRGSAKLRLGELFDLATDIGETIDLAAQFPQLVAELEQLRVAREVDILASRTPAAPTQRKRPTWRAQFGLPTGNVLSDGQSWEESEQGAWPFIVVDQDVVNDFIRVPASPNRPLIAPTMAVRASLPSPDLRFERRGVEFTGLAEGAMSVTLWWTTQPALDQEVVLLDIGDDERGLSLTIGDFGLLGDDAQSGRCDDLRVCVGGSASLGSATIESDLSGGDDRMTSLGVTLSRTGLLRAYQDGFELGAVDCGAPVSWGGDEEWSLLGRHGQLGGSGASSAPPMLATAGGGEVAGLRVWDRELQRGEVEGEYGRYLAIPYCGSQTNSTGAVARLTLFGSFIPSERRTWAQIEGLPTGSIGVLAAGSQQTRWAVLSGNLCLSGTIVRLKVVATPPGQNSILAPVFEPHGSTNPNQWLPFAGSRWNFQFVYRDGVVGRMTNAEQIYFSL
jgi:arylsulfatase A